MCVGSRSGYPVKNYDDCSVLVDMSQGMKGHVMKVALEEYGHVCLMTLFQMVDDTKLMTKSIVPELLERLPELLADKYGQRIVLQLLSPDDKRYVPLEVQGWIHPAPRHVGKTGKDAGEEGEEDVERVEADEEMEEEEEKDDGEDSEDEEDNGEVSLIVFMA